MELTDLSVAKRSEIVLLALDWALQDLTASATTDAVARIIARRLNAGRHLGVISRIIVKAADRVPEAARGDTFVKYGKTMRRVIWHPKGTLPEGGLTREAKREARKALSSEEQYLAYCADLGIDPDTGQRINPETWSV